MQPDTDALLQILQAEAACRALILRSAALADAGEVDALAALFTADARLTRPTGTLLQGRTAIAAAYRERPAQRITVHLVCGTLFEALAPHEARTTSRVLLWAGDIRRDNGAQGREADARQIVGRFIDRLVRQAEGWRIAERIASFDLHSPE